MSKAKLLVACLSAVLWLATISPEGLIAQSQRTPVRVWVAGGLGSGGASRGAGEGGAASLALAFQKAPHQVTVRYIGMLDIFDPGASALGELSALYWRVQAGRWGHLGVGSGVALALQNPCSGQCDGETRIALPLSAEATLRLLPVAAVGVQAFSNVSANGVMGGLLFVLQLGWLPR